VHREYTSAFPAKIIIERDRIVAENWNLPKAPGRIDPNNFSPFPKNPILANFFVNIGRADVLGSGVRNLYEYTKIYSGGEPELIDGDVFKTIIPLSLTNGFGSDKQSTSDKTSDKQITSDKTGDKTHQQAIFSYLAEHTEINAAITASIIDRSPGTARKILAQLVGEGRLIASGANKNRTYRLKGDIN
jgi:ATP-dependent DNA helicase RecG